MEIISGPQPASTPSVQAQACSGVRLELKRNIPDLAWVDGAWWPRTTDLTAELPPLLTALFDRVGTAAMVGYQLNAWNFAEPHLDTVVGRVVLQGFTGDDLQTVLVVGTDGQRLTLLVIPPGTGNATALGALQAVARPTSAPNRPRSHSDGAIEQSLEEVAKRLADLGRRTDERTENIARWVQEAGREFVNAPVQAFVPILVEHIVRQKLGSSARTPIAEP
jgi:hypothetical protein